MPTIANRAQQVYTGGMYPVSAYSRIMGLGVTVLEDGVFKWNITPPVGNKVWLLNVTVRCNPKPANLSQGTLITLYAGEGLVTQEADFEYWDKILPILNQDNTILPVLMTDGVNEMSWSMSKLYKGDHRRFGIGANRLGGFMTDAIYAEFTIAEG